MATRTRFLPVLPVAILFAACTAASSPSPETSLEPASGEPTPKPCVTSETPAASAFPGFVCGAELVPGDYTSTSTGAIITFTLAGDDWSGSEDIQGEGFALFNDAVGGQHGISVVAYDGEVFSAVCSAATAEMIGAAPADLITFLASVEGVQAEEPVDTHVGGRPAIRLDLTTVSPCPDDRMWLWTFPEHRDFHFNDAERVRVYAVDAGTATVVLVIEAFPDADYDVLLQKAEEVIATMTLAPDS